MPWNLADLSLQKPQGPQGQSKLISLRRYGTTERSHPHSDYIRPTQLSLAVIARMCIIIALLKKVTVLAYVLFALNGSTYRVDETITVYLISGRRYCVGLQISQSVRPAQRGRQFARRPFLGKYVT